MAAYQKLYPRFRQAQAEVAAISVDAPKMSADLSSSLRLSFPLLSDVDKKVLVDWSALNKAARGGIAYPSTWVIDKDLVVRYRVLERKAKRVDAGPVLRFLRGELGRTDAEELSVIRLNVKGTTRWLKDVMRRPFRKPDR